MRVNDEPRKKLASGAVVMAHLGEHFELLRRAADGQVREGHASLIAIDHRQAILSAPGSGSADDDAH